METFKVTFSINNYIYPIMSFIYYVLRTVYQEINNSLISLRNVSINRVTFNHLFIVFLYKLFEKIKYEEKV